MMVTRLIQRLRGKRAGRSLIQASKQSMLCARLRDFPGDLEGSMGVAMTEKWLEFLFYPGRFSTASIETALYTYRKGRGLTSTVTGQGAEGSGAATQRAPQPSDRCENHSQASTQRPAEL